MKAASWNTKKNGSNWGYCCILFEKNIVRCFVQRHIRPFTDRPALQ